MKKINWDDIDDYTRSKKLTLYGWIGLPIFLLCSILSSFIMIIGWAVVQALGGPAIINFDSSGMPVLADEKSLLLVSVAFGMLAYPLVWLIFPFARRQNKFVGGYGIKDIDKRMHTDGNKTKGWLKAIGIGVVIGILTAIVMTVLQIIATPILQGRDQSDTTTAMVVDSFNSITNGNNAYLTQALLMVISAFLIGPICEEFLFRGLIGMSFRDSRMFRKLSDKTRMIVICLLSGLVFGAMHFQPGDIVVSMMTMLFTGLIGAGFSYFALYRYNSLVPTMAAHVTYNTLAVVVSVILGV